MRFQLLCLSLITVVAPGLQAQTAGDSVRLPAEPISALGLPPQWQPYASLFGIVSRSSGGVGALAGMSHPLMNPVTGLLAASAEGNIEQRSSSTLGGLRLRARVPALGISAGIDWQNTNGFAPILSFETAIRRGGLLGRGTMLRVDWLPGSRHELDLGVNVPLFQPFAGRTRPRRTVVSLPGASDAKNVTPVALTDSTRAALAVVAEGAKLIGAYTNLYTAADEQTLIAARAPPTFDSVTRRYHQALGQAFALAAVDTTARISTRARTGVLNDVILPYDGLFGQAKDGCRIDGLLGNARSNFERWLRDSIVASETTRSRVMAVHDRWLAVVHNQCKEQLREGKDSRLAWLPLQLALAPDEYGNQDQVDALLAQAVGHAFTDHNALRYLRTADLALEIARSILAARRYHVLWTHDFTGRRDYTGTLDDMAYTMVADVYLPALTAAVSRYDTTGTFPQYIIFLDAFYYHGRDGSLWMSILENPLRASVRFKAGEEAQAAHLRQRLSELRATLARSVRLRREAATRGGDRWLEQVVRVHVNVTQPSDFSFRSHRILAPVPFTADNVMRDHRKLAFYDVTESAPYDGALLVTGIGIGEHYSSMTWEDRGYEIRGPAALEARAAARRLLATNGIDADRLPPALRETPGTAATDAALANPQAARAYIGHALQVHNEVGFGAKNASVARAMLYTLAPPGTVIVVPDPLWVSESWAAMLAAAAARGCHVMIIAPALANAPSPQTPIIVLERAMLYRMLAIQRHLASRIAAAGGSLHIGIYAEQASVSDVAKRFAEVRAGLTSAPWIRELIPFDAPTLDELNRALAQTEATDSVATTIARDEAPRAPQLHQKTVLVARASAIAALVRQPGWADILAQTMRGQARRTGRLADAIGGPLPPVDTTAGQAIDALIQRYEQSLTPADRKRANFYFLVGTQNHDPRGIMLDGEATTILGGVQASAGLVDLFYLMTRTTWIDTPSEIDRLVPAPRGLVAKFARFLRFVM